MGWREREYARFTDEERRRFFDTAAAGTPRAGGRIGVSRGAGAAVLVSGALLVLGQLPRNHPLLPTLHFTIPGLARPAERAAPPRVVHSRALRLPPSLPRRSILTIRGHLEGYDGRLVTLEARSSKSRWRTVAVRRIPRGGSF